MRRGLRLSRSTLAAIAGLVALVAGCAKVAPPSGGPEDRTFPRVIGMAPDSGSVDARPDTLSILFSKKMNRGSVRDWLFVTPRVSVAEYAWRENRLEIVLLERPDSGRTYGILLGAEATDRRNNSIGPWSAAFSTGGRLDDGMVEGEVRSGRLKAAGSYLYVWPWSDSLPATDGEIPTPLRMGQSGKDGKFRIPFLPRNEALRICALFDGRKDRSFDTEDDLWGCCSDPIVLDDTTRTRTGVEIYLVFPDEPGTVSGAAVDSSCVGKGVGRLRALNREADSLAVLLGARAGSDSLPADSLLGFAKKGKVEFDSTAVRSRLAEMDSLRAVARIDSARCALPVIVRLFEKDSTLVAEVQGDGAFEFRDVAPGVYRIRAFRDADSNGESGSGEAAGEYPFPIEVAPGRALTDLRFRLEPR